ncbi:hypothetical protein POM88_008669 [Heracleum sosnowskyi]|uniref:Uncharacterized protein n=1 Tax=Heracleum sosnowskyi TaxID=360622 RepID=A0AAD8N7K6_9APIA|nr:hypothetical protein POM88_008669 [Heracleum sosnowskyi]
MAHYPKSPQHSRMLLTVIEIYEKGIDRPNLVLAYAVAVAAALSLSDLFITQPEGNNDKNGAATTYALHCFEIFNSPKKFCAEYSLHYKTMEEMSKLRKQLLKLVFQQSLCASQQHLSWTHGNMEDVECWRHLSDEKPLSTYEEEILHAAICTGWG